MVRKYIPTLIVLTFTATILLTPAFAQEEGAGKVSETASVSRFLAAAVAFGSAALGAAWAIGKAGSAGLAGAAERPEIRTTAIIITALGEALAIYGIVIAILILGTGAV